MGEPRGPQVQDDLIAALAEESALVSRYLYFAKIADIEGEPATAQLFRDLAESGICNAHGALDFLRQIGDWTAERQIADTEQNLRNALSLESREHAVSYPDRALRARQGGQSDLASWFETLARLKQHHAAELEGALGRLRAGARARGGAEPDPEASRGPGI